MQSSNNSKIVFHENALGDWNWGMKKWCHTNGNAKKTGILIHISEKIDFKARLYKRQMRHYIMVKRSI